VIRTINLFTKAVPDTDEEKSIHQSVFQKLGNKMGVRRLY